MKITLRQVTDTENESKQNQELNQESSKATPKITLRQINPETQNALQGEQKVPEKKYAPTLPQPKSSPFQQDAGVEAGKPDALKLQDYYSRRNELTTGGNASGVPFDINIGKLEQEGKIDSTTKQTILSKTATELENIEQAHTVQTQPKPLPIQSGLAARTNDLFYQQNAQHENERQKLWEQKEVLENAIHRPVETVEDIAAQDVLKSQLADVDKQLRDIGENFSTGKLAKGILEQGTSSITSNTAATVDLIASLIPRMATAIVHAAGDKDADYRDVVGYKQIHEWNEALQNDKTRIAAKYADNIRNGSWLAKKSNEWGVSTINAIPMAIMAFSTGGQSLAANGADVALRAANTVPGMSKTVGTVMKSMVKNPNYWTAFLNVVGNSYNEAIEDGATENQAVAFALINGSFNAALEGEYGIQEFAANPEAWGFKTFVKEAMGGEAKEEVLQGIAERALQNLVYNKGNDLIPTNLNHEGNTTWEKVKNAYSSMARSNAVLNPATAIDEAAGGAVVGGILGGGGVLSNTAANKINEGIYEHAKKNPDKLIKIANNALKNRENLTSKDIFNLQFAREGIGKLLEDGNLTDEQRTQLQELYDDVSFTLVLDMAKRQRSVEEPGEVEAPTEPAAPESERIRNTNKMLATADAIIAKGEINERDQKSLDFMGKYLTEALGDPSLTPEEREVVTAALERVRPYLTAQETGPAYSVPTQKTTAGEGIMSVEYPAIGKKIQDTYTFHKSFVPEGTQLYNIVSTAPLKDFDVIKITTDGDGAGNIELIKYDDFDGAANPAIIHSVTGTQTANGYNWSTVDSDIGEVLTDKYTVVPEGYEGFDVQAAKDAEKAWKDLANKYGIRYNANDIKTAEGFNRLMERIKAAIEAETQAQTQTAPQQPISAPREEAPAETTPAEAPAQTEAPAEVETPVEAEPVQQEAPKPKAETKDEYDTLASDLDARGQVDANGLRFRVYPVVFGKEGFYNSVSRIEGSEGPVTNARAQIYHEGPFPTKQEAIDDLVAVARNNNFLQSRAQESAPAETAPEEAPTEAPAETQEKPSKSYEDTFPIDYYKIIKSGGQISVEMPSTDPNDIFGDSFYYSLNENGDIVERSYGELDENDELKTRVKVLSGMSEQEFKDMLVSLAEKGGEVEIAEYSGGEPVYEIVSGLKVNGEVEYGGFTYVVDKDFGSGYIGIVYRGEDTPENQIYEVSDNSRDRVIKQLASFDVKALAHGAVETAANEQVNQPGINFYKLLEDGGEIAVSRGSEEPRIYFIDGRDVYQLEYRNGKEVETLIPDMDEGSFDEYLARELSNGYSVRITEMPVSSKAIDEIRIGLSNGDEFEYNGFTYSIKEDKGKYLGEVSVKGPNGEQTVLYRTSKRPTKGEIAELLGSVDLTDYRNAPIEEATKTEYNEKGGNTTAVTQEPSSPTSTESAPSKPRAPRTMSESEPQPGETGRNDNGNGNRGLSDVPEPGEVQGVQEGGNAETGNGVLGQPTSMETTADERPNVQELPGEQGVPNNGLRGEAPSDSVDRPASPGVSEGGDTSGDRGFVIKKDPLEANSTPVKRFDANIAAIKTLNEILDSGRDYATPEEREVLAGYTGWGGLKTAFTTDSSTRQTWLNRQEELKSLVGEKEYRDIVSSSLSAFYTPKEIVDSMYDILDELGFTNGVMLEPSCGTGIFLGAMPNKYRSNKIYAVEKDATSGTIAKLLYPNADVLVDGFETFDIPRKSVDLVIGNVPFLGNVSLYDKNFPEYKNEDAHNFFILKGLDLLKPGGVMMVIAPTSTMDNSPATLSRISDKANLVDAFRFPSGTFKGTSVSADLLIFQKKLVDQSSPIDESLMADESNMVDIEDEGGGADYIDSFMPNSEDEVEENSKAFTRIAIVDGIKINNFFVEHPDRVLGTLEKKTRGNTKYYEVAPSGASLKSLIKTIPKNIVQQKKQEIYNREIRQVVAPQSQPVEELTKRGLSPGMFYVDGDKVMRVNELGESEPAYRFKSDGEKLVYTGKTLERVKDFITVADAYNEYLNTMMAESDDDKLEAPRKKFNDAYDAFVKKYAGKNSEGALSATYNNTILHGDLRYNQLVATEVSYRDEDGNIRYKKGDVFFKRTVNAPKKITSVENAQDALIASLNVLGTIDFDYMEGLYGKDKDQMLRELGDNVFEVPNSDGKYEIAARYLSGPVKKKLEIAKAANKDGKYDANVRALEAVIPIDVEAADISVNLGASWVGEDTIKEFAADLASVPVNAVTVAYSPATGRWSVTIPRGAVSSRWGTDERSVEEILTAALNKERITINFPTERGEKPVINQQATDNANAKVAEMNEYFKDWVWRDEARRERLQRTYNDIFNDRVDMTYDGEFLTLPGISSSVTLYKHQKNGIYRILTDRSTLLVHPAGSGKTFEMLAAAHEMKRLGMANKILFVVPNQKLEDFVSDYFRLYPNGKVLAVRGKEWSKKSRQLMIRQMQTTDPDIIIIRHSSFESFGFSKEYEKEYVERRKKELEEAIIAGREAGMKQRDITNMEKRVANYEKELNELQDRKTDDIIPFDKVGIDAMFVDEAHNFKNLINPTSHSRLAGANTGDSKKSTRMHMATELMAEQGNKVVFATATPISNTMGEIYNMFKYLRPDLLEAYQIKSYDAFINNFAEIVNAAEPNTTGTGIQMKERLSKFNNIPELVSGFRQFADVLQDSDLNLKRPARKDVHITVSASELLKAFNRYVDWMKNQIKGQKPGDRVEGEPIDTQLTLYEDAKMAALDMRLVLDVMKERGLVPESLTPEELDFEGSKINTLVKTIMQEYNDSTDRKGTQVVFLDRGVPIKFTKKVQEEIARLVEKYNSEEGLTEAEEQKLKDYIASKRYNFDLYNDIKQKLMAQGVPESEIAFIQDTQGSNSDQKKKALFEKVQRGEVRILLGSTQMMGEGMNVQDRAVAVHNVNAPARPADITQRNARVWRQQNTNKDVRIYYYSTQNSFDAALWHTLDTKNKFIQSVLAGNKDIRSMEDLGENGFEGMSVEAANNPLMFRRAELIEAIRLLEAQKRNVAENQFRYQNIISNHADNMAKAKADLNVYRDMEKTVKANPDNKITLLGKEYESYGEATKALAEWIKHKMKRNIADKGFQTIGTMHGLPIQVNLQDNFGSRMTLRAGDSYLAIPVYADLTVDIGGNLAQSNDLRKFDTALQRLNNTLRLDGKNNCLGANIKNAESHISSLESQYEDAKKNVGRTFAKEDELRADKEELREVEKALGATAKDLVNPFTSGFNVREVIAAEAEKNHEAQVEVGDEDGIDFSIGAYEDVDKKSGKTSPERQWTTTRDGSLEVKPDPLSKIVMDLANAFKVQITKGHIKSSKTLGTYNRQNKGIRTQSDYDLPTICHELGHMLDRKYGITEDVSWKAKRELVNNMEPSFRKLYKKKKWKTEGMAEFLRHYLENKTETILKYPEFIKHFYDSISQEDKDALDIFADRVNAYYALNGDTATDTIRMRADGTYDPRSLAERLKDRAHVLYQAIFDSNHSLSLVDDAVGGGLHMYATNAFYAGAMADYVIEGEIRDFNGNYVGPGLIESLHGLNLNDKKEYMLFGEYLKCKHGIERLKYGKQVFADPRKNNVEWMENRVATLEEEHPIFKEVAQRVYEYRKNIMKMAVDMELISDELLDKLDDRYQYYVPFYRVIAKKGKGTVKAGYVNQPSLINTAYGSGLDTWHPIDNLMQLTMNIYHSGVPNRVAATLANVADAEGLNALIMEHVDAPTVKEMFRTDQIKKLLDQSLEKAIMDGRIKSSEDIDVMAQIILNLNDVVFQYKRGAAHGNVVCIMRNGKPDYWKINDPLLLETLTNMSPLKATGVANIIGRLSKFMTQNITGLNVVWSLFSNAPRDIQTWMYYSPSKRLDQLIKGMALSYKDSIAGALGREQTDIHKMYMALGGNDTSAYTVDVDTSKRIMRKMAKAFPTPLDMLDFIGNTIERAPREALFRIALKSGLTPEEAMYAAHDITVNFGRGGIYSRELNKFIPFFNAGVQGLDKYARYFAADDVKGNPEKRGKAAATRFLAYLAFSAMTALAFSALHHRDEDTAEAYERLSSYTKNAYYLIPIGDDRFFAISKARELSIPESLFEALIERVLYKDKHALDDFYEYATDNMLPNGVAEVAQFDLSGIIGSLGIIGVAHYTTSNRDFLGRPIESTADQYLMAKDRYNGQTSKAAYLIAQAINATKAGRKLGISPKKIDYFFNSSLGGWWKYQKALFPMDEAFRDPTLGVKNTYVKDSLYSTDLVNWMYDEAEKSAQESKSDPNDLDKAYKAAMDEKMSEFYSNYLSTTRGLPSSSTDRATKEAMLDVLFDYRDAVDNDYMTTDQKAVLKVCKANKSMEFLPAVMSAQIKDGADKSYELSDKDYYEYQTTYLDYYYDLAGRTLNTFSSNEDKALLLRTVKDVARERAKSDLIKKKKWTGTDYFNKYEGLSDETIVKFKTLIKIGDDDDTKAQAECIAAIEKLGLSGEDSYTLFRSKYNSDKNNPWAEYAH